MGGRAYLARLALGRSAYEPFRSAQSEGISPGQISHPCVKTDSPGSQNWSPTSYVQHFDHNGRPHNPVSRALSRQSRRALNDVLAIAGVIAGPDTSPTHYLQAAELPYLVETSAESEAGSWISVAGRLTATYIHSRMAIARHRLQTFRFYAGIPFLSILETEWRISGLSFLLLAGVPGELFKIVIFCILQTHRSVRLACSESMITEGLYAKSPGLAYLSELCMAVVNVSVELACFLGYAALRFTSILQGLGLLPLRHSYPTADTLVRLMTVSFAIPFQSSSNLAVRSGLASLIAVATSPAVLFFTLGHTRKVIASKVSTYVQLALPIPDDPDFQSVVVAADRRFDRSRARGFDLTPDSVNDEPVGNCRSVWKQARMDWAALSNHLHSIASWSRSVFTGGRRSGFCSDEVQDHGIRSLMMESSKISQEDQPTESDDDASITSTENESDSSNSEPEQTAASLNQTHRHTERTALTGLDTRRRGDDESKPCHRVTNLSSGPADTMAFSVSTMVASIILLPLETLLVRSVATAYLTTSGPSSASCYWLREEIYPTGSWFGMGLRGGRAMDYARKMVLCFGMEMVLGYGVWQIGAGVTWWIGKWFFNWGKLQGSP